MGSIHATSLFCGPERGLKTDAVLIHEGGVITSVDTVKQLEPGRRLVLPALVNAHDHARPTASSFGSLNMPLETWILRSPLIAPPDPYLTAAVSFGRNIRAGTGAMMVHYTKPSGRMGMVDEAKAIARAAQDVGIRIAFALAVRDQNPLVYGDAAGILAALPADARAIVEQGLPPAPKSPQAYLDLIEEIATAIAGPMVDVQLGPAGVQWCSRPLLEAIAGHSASTGRRIHMHLLETVYQRAWADKVFPEGIVRYLRDIGFLSERVTLAHCIHARPDELDMIAASGARIVTNFSSNLHLHSGLAPIADAHRRGCAIAVGVDGVALDEDDDVLREMRLVQMAHDGIGFERTWTRAGFFGLAIRNGRRAIGASGDGILQSGEPADYVVIDYDRLDRDGLMPLDPLDLLFARGNASHVAEVVVAGRSVARDGLPTGIDLPAMETELRAAYRRAISVQSGFLSAWTVLEGKVGRWYTEACGCGA
jgi:cytosine/adenosine deaminase-related metal-dependent hydrolase